MLGRAGAWATACVTAAALAAATPPRARNLRRFMDAPREGMEVGVGPTAPFSPINAPRCLRRAENNPVHPVKTTWYISRKEPGTSARHVAEPAGLVVRDRLANFVFGVHDE